MISVTLPSDFHYVKSSVNSTRLSVRVSINKLNLFPTQIMPSFIGVFRNGWGYSWGWVRESRMSPSCSSIRSVCIFPFRQYILFHVCEKSYTRLHFVFVDQQLQDLKSDRIPCSRQRRSGSVYNPIKYGRTAVDFMGSLCNTAITFHRYQVTLIFLWRDWSCSISVL